MKAGISEIVVRTCVYTVMIALCAVTLYPFYYVFLYSISDPVRVSAHPVIFLPVGFTLQNYRAVFVNSTLVDSFFVTIGRTVSGSLLHIAVTGLAAYSLSKSDLIFRRFFLVLFIIPMYFSGGLLPYYVLVTRLGLTNNFLVYILPSAFSTFNMLLMRVYFRQLPPSIEESARIDGASDITVFFRIIIPSSMPIFATVLMFVGVAQWNSWFDAFLFVNKPNMMPLQTVLYKIILENDVRTLEDIMRKLSQGKSLSPEAIKMSALVVSTAPILAVYPFLQKYFVKGMLIGAVKG